MPEHPFTVVVDRDTQRGHVFYSLSVCISGEWTLLERRCVLCHSVPLDLLAKDGGMAECDGLMLP